MRLETQYGEILYNLGRPSAAAYLARIDTTPSTPSKVLFDSWFERIAAVRTRHSKRPDAFFNDLFVLERCIDFLSAYGHVWCLIAQGQFAASWDALQGALDLLRLIRRHSCLDIAGVETQLIELEKAYPYAVFFSLGATVEFFECSICGCDIDSLACPHRRGSLYRGVMAYAIAKQMTDIDHVAMVSQPRDKRCVERLEDDDPRFAVVRKLAELLSEGVLRPSQFGQLLFSTRRMRNPEFRILGRNEPCFCGSGKKFKRCCIQKGHIERSHVDIVMHPEACRIG